jgi:C4-dicarboxylate transporter, DctM subunit
MENLIVIVALVLFMYFLVMGQYISSLFLAVGAFGIFLLGGMERLGGFLKSDAFSMTTTYSLTTIPLYILMAQFLMKTDIVGDLYNLVFKISKGRRGPLGVLTIVLGGLLGAVSGSSTATSAAVAQISVPELQKKGYSNYLAGAIVASSGSLSSIIPPSIILILYGVIAQISIGKLFIAALIPGILLTICFALVVILYLQFNREKVGATVNDDMENNLPVSRYIISIVMGALMVLAIFGGIFTGVFTPTEAGAVGSAIAIIMAAFLKKLNMNFLLTSITETTKITVMTIFIVIGASLFGRFISLSLVPRKIIALLEPLMETPTLVIVILLLIYFILFMIIDSVAVILMTVPIMTPIVDALQVDPLWFAIMVSLSCTMGLITPPVGTSVYVVGSVTGISIEGIFKISMIFAVIGTIIIMGLLIIFPELVTWLPSKM